MLHSLVQLAECTIPNVMQLDVAAIIILLGMAQAFFLGLGLLVLRKNRIAIANTFLGLLFLSISFSLIYAFLVRTNLYRSFPHFLNLSTPTLFLFGPLFFLYVTALTSTTFKLTRHHANHFIPFFVTIVYFVPFYLLTGDEKIAKVDLMIQGDVPLEAMMFGSAQIIHFTTYLIAVYLLLQKHTKNVQANFSTLEKINLRWLRFVVYGFAVIYAMMFAAFLLMLIGIKVYSIMQYGVAMVASIAVYTMGYMGLRQPLIFHGENIVEAPKKYEQSTMTEELAAKYLEQLLRTMNEKKSYTDPELTIQRLSEITSIPAYHLSQLLNEQLSKNFYDYINGLRIEEAKTNFKDPKKSHYSIFAIAEESGFHSKSVFNTAFKKYTGITPSEFRKTAQI